MATSVFDEGGDEYARRQWRDDLVRIGAKTFEYAQLNGAGEQEATLLAYEEVLKAGDW